MSRHLCLLGLVAVPMIALTACDTQSTLSKAKPGECYAVVGRGSMGDPKLAKTACAGSPAALAAACPAPTAPATAAPGAACPATGKKAAATGSRASTGAAAVGTSARGSGHGAQRARTASHAAYASREYSVAKSGEVTSLGLDYARVDQDLAGGPRAYAGGYERGGEYARADQYERREHHGRVDHGPPPPPPAYHARSGAAVEYSERSRQSRSYSESYMSSSRGGYGRVDCDCDGRGQPPHSPFDGNGYLTWRGKTPG